VLSWLVRGLLIIGGVVTSWFVAKDTVHFGAIQMTITVLLMILVVFALAFWPARWTIKFDGRSKRPPPT
jgi:hypothetical protein